MEQLVEKNASAISTTPLLLVMSNAQSIQLHSKLVLVMEIVIGEMTKLACAVVKNIGSAHLATLNALQVIAFNNMVMSTLNVIKKLESVNA